MALKGFKDAMNQKVAEAQTTGEEKVKKPVPERIGGVGMGLLNSASMAEKRVEEYPLIDVNEIVPNEKNKYEINEIEELMESLLEVGLLQPLVGYYMKDGKVKLTTGQRRWTACKRLADEGHADFQRVPVKIQSIESINLDLSDDLKEKYAIIVTNKERRNELSPAETLFEVETLREIYSELAKKGKKPKGNRRKLIADDLGVDERTVARYTNISLKATDEVRESFENEDIDLATTQALVKEEPEVQKKAVEKIKEEIVDKEPSEKKAAVTKAINEAKAEINKEKNIDEVAEDEEVTIPEDEIKKVTKKMKETNKVISNAIGQVMSKEDLKHFTSDTKKLIRLLDEIEEILNNK